MKRVKNISTHKEIPSKYLHMKAIKNINFRHLNKILFISLLFFGILSISAQEQNRYERIKALKTAHISNSVGLTSAEAEKFWPIYNKYEKELHLLKVVEKRELMRKLKDEGGLDALSEPESKTLKNNIFNLRKEIFTKEQEKYQALDKVLSSNKIVKLYGAEESFKHELLRIFKGKKRGRNF